MHKIKCLWKAVIWRSYLNTQAVQLSGPPQIKPKPHALPKNAEEKTRGEENQTTFQTMKITEDVPRTI